MIKKREKLFCFLAMLVYLSSVGATTTGRILKGLAVTTTASKLSTTGSATSSQASSDIHGLETVSSVPDKAMEKLEMTAGTELSEVSETMVPRSRPSTELQTSDEQTVIPENDLIRTPGSIAERVEELALSADALDIFMDAVESVVMEKEDHIIIPEEIDPEQRNITVEDAFLHLGEFLTEQMEEAQNMLSEIEEELDGIDDANDRWENEIQRNSILQTQKDKILDIIQAFTDNIEYLQEYRQSYSVEDFDYYDQMGSDDFGPVDGGDELDAGDDRDESEDHTTFGMDLGNDVVNHQSTSPIQTIQDIETTSSLLPELDVLANDLDMDLLNPVSDGDRNDDYGYNELGTGIIALIVVPIVLIILVGLSVFIRVKRYGGLRRRVRVVNIVQPRAMPYQQMPHVAVVSICERASRPNPPTDQDLLPSYLEVISKNDQPPPRYETCGDGTFDIRKYQTPPVYAEKDISSDAAALIPREK